MLCTFWSVNNLNENTILKTMHKMPMFYELGIGWLYVKIPLKNGFIGF